VLSSVSFEEAAAQLIQESFSDPWGKCSASIYETARVISLLPPTLWPDSQKSLLFLLHRQNRNGSWGDPGMYCIVPSLAATACLLCFTRRALAGEEIPVDISQLLQCTYKGLFFLQHAMYAEILANLPDTIAVELVVPALIEEIHHTLDSMASA